MTQIISAREANQRFSYILGKATGGETIVITRRGKPVAQLVPYSGKNLEPGRAKAWDRLVQILEAGLNLGGETFARDRLYDR